MRNILRIRKLAIILKRICFSVWAKILSFASFATATVFWLFNLFTMEVVLADGNLKGSVFYKGTEKLLKDLSSAVLVLAPIVTVVVVMYCFIRKGAADEMDHKKWQTRITTAILCGIGAVAAAALINMFAAYYGVADF